MIQILTSAPPRSILVLSGRHHIIYNALIVNICILNKITQEKSRLSTVFNSILYITPITCIFAIMVGRLRAVIEKI